MAECKEMTGRAELHRRILQTAGEAFRQYGIRSVRMDDIAAAVGISKRTLYEEFADKEVMLVEVLEGLYEESRRKLKVFWEESDNVVKVILRHMQMNLKWFSNTNTRFFEDMKRYPEVTAYFKKIREDNWERTVVFMQGGVEQGLLRRDVNLHIYLKAQQAVFDCTIRSLEDEALYPEAYRTLLLVLLRGICTPEGGRLMDEYLLEMEEEEKSRLRDGQDAPE